MPPSIVGEIEVEAFSQLELVQNELAYTADYRDAESVKQLARHAVMAMTPA